MNALRHRWARIAITLIPLALALLHATGAWRLPFLDRLDHFVYDVRLRATMPRTLDPRIVIVDIDEASLLRHGQWPWSRDKLARLTRELTDRQHTAVIGFDVLFVEPDASSGVNALREMARGALRDDERFAAELERIAPTLDHDRAFADALTGRKVALGFYLSQSREPRATGVLPAPVLALNAFSSNGSYATGWNGYGANIAVLAAAAPIAGFLNVMLDGGEDGVVRTVPLLARHEGPGAPGYYESLALAVYRIAEGLPAIAPVFAPGAMPKQAPALQSLVLRRAGFMPQSLPVDQRASVFIPFRGAGGPRGGSFRYVPAADVIDGLLAPDALRDKIVLIGATAPGLQDLRTTPVNVVYPGVEVHANIISALMDRRLAAAPDYAQGYDVVVLVIVGLALAFGLSLASAPIAALIAAVVLAGLAALNTWLYLHAGLVFPIAAALAMIAFAFVLNMSWAYFVEARASRRLADLFGTYVPPQLVDEMRASPHRYSMRAESRELTVMFCDMRGFTQLSERMAPVELQAFLNTIFSRLTEIISAHKGTVDKYMGDCVMAFWGAPVELPDHAALAVAAAAEMAAVVRELNHAHRTAGQPQISVGIGINTGLMSVGDMGSAVRRSYTVVGDAVNLASRLEGLGVHYGVEIVASASTQAASPGWLWQELDLVRVRGKAEALSIFTPVALARNADAAQREALSQWALILSLYRERQAQQALSILSPLVDTDAKKVLYRLYAERLASMTLLPKDPDWDGATRFETK